MADQKTTEDLRVILFDTIDKVKNKKIDDREANAIAKLAAQVIQSANLEMKYAETVSRLDKDDQGVSPGPMMLANKSEEK